MTFQMALIVAFSILDLVCILAVIFVERKSPSSTIAWVMVLSFFPFVGFLCYLLFGSGFHLNKKRSYALKTMRDAGYKAFITEYAELAVEAGKVACSLACARMIRTMSDGEYHPYTQGNTAELFTDGTVMFAKMLEDMRTATRQIHLLYYIFRNDALGREIVALLTEKARQGVEVRVMYDSLGSFLATGRMFEPLREAGGAIEAFSPIFFTFSSHFRLNYRNHRKITVIDGVIGYVGGMNIGEEYRGKHRRLRPWRDTHLRLCGPAVSFLQERFVLDWMYASETVLQEEHVAKFFHKPKVADGLGVQIVSSGPDTSSALIKSGLLEMLYAARRSVYIQTPYFAPDASFIDALTIAARGGVDVRIMLPGIGDHPFVQYATYSYADYLLKAGVKIYKYNGFLHAKTMVFDREAATVGTANIGNRSFVLNFEVNAFIYDAAFATQCEQVFLADQEQCMELTEEWFANRSLFTRAGYSLSRLLSPLI